MSLRIVQLTDCHLFARRDQRLREVATWPRLERVLQSIRQQVPDFDLLVVTGDTAHDESLETYRAVRVILEDWNERSLLIPGNHDSRSGLCASFSSLAPDEEGRVTFCIRRNGWQLIGLDSQLPGEVAGMLGDAQRHRLRRQLAEHPELPTTLFMHHPPVPVASKFLDDIRLRDAAELAELLADSSQVRLILCGHVHQQVTGSLASATVLTTPAVGPQFRPRHATLEITGQPPCWRLVELGADGCWSTQVFES